MFSMIKIKSDIAFSLTVPARFAKNPSYTYTKAVKTFFHHLKRSINCSITYGIHGVDLFIKGYLDSN